MALRKIWQVNPTAGGLLIPDEVKKDIISRINRVAEENFKGRYTRLDIRFRGQFCYIDALEVDDPAQNWLTEIISVSTDESSGKERSIPTHLCRLRYFGNDHWGFGFYTYSNEKYELSVYPDGSFVGKPEVAFIEAAKVYLS